MIGIFIILISISIVIVWVVDFLLLMVWFSVMVLLYRNRRISMEVSWVF